MLPAKVTPAEFAALPEMRDWRFSLNMVRSEFQADTFSKGAEFAAFVAALADEQNHHPDINLRYPGRVRISMSTHDTGSLSEADVRLAGAVSARAAELGYPAVPLSTQGIEFAIDTADLDAIRPFWAAVLDYRLEHDDAVADPRGEGPPLWFQTIDEGETLRSDRNRFHLDVSVPHDVAKERVTAALAAGGTLVSDERARAFWVLADAEGNEACVCTWQDRH